MKRLTFGVMLASILLWSVQTVRGFCGFYVGKADTTLFNHASQVILVRDGDRTVMTMVNDFKGNLKEFAIVIPVPTILERGQIHVGDKALVDHIEAYSAPRLVEYYDEDPCRPLLWRETVPMAAARGGLEDDRDRSAISLGVRIEAQYSVGEYDILILSAAESAGLETWLRGNGYRIPAGASAVLSSYLKQNMHFFVAKVNLAAQAQLGFSYLRPLQIAYESPKFMLPIRLGMVNADGPQDLFVFALTRNGRVESTNYRTTRLPSGMDLPEFLKDGAEFMGFYKAMFTHEVQREQGRAVFLEYAWNMGWCDPCAAAPLSKDEMSRLGVYWAGGSGRPYQSQDTFLTRLHVRYDKAHFPEDLVFQETGDRTNFQARYVLRHAGTGSSSCAASDSYRQGVRDRHEREVERLVSLTGWETSVVRKKAGLGESAANQVSPIKWWERLWPR